jgi:hypothetical protein
MALRARAFSSNNVENVIGNPLQGKSGLQKSNGTSNLQRSALGEIKNTRSQSIISGRDAKAFKQPLKPSLTIKAKEKENVEVPELPINDQIEPMSIDFEPARASSPVPQDVGAAFIEDVDIEDAGNPQLVVDYVQDIYKYLRQVETTQRIETDYLRGQDVITPKMRSVLVDWLIGVHLQFHLLQETLYTTIAIIDRFMQAEIGHGTVTREKLQLVGVAAMLIASKYEEIYAPEVKDMVYITDRAYTRKEIIKMEIKILHVLNFDLGRPLPLHFLRRASKAGGVEAVTHTLAKYIMELSLGSYSMAPIAPSQLAAAALALAMRLLDPCAELKDLWSRTLIHYTQYRVYDLQPIILKLADLLVKAPKAKQSTVYNKYSNKKFMKIARIPALDESDVEHIANGEDL